LTNLKERIHLLISEYGVTLNFLWVPGHVQIKGNEGADRLAKESLELDGEPTGRLPFSDFKSLVKPFMRDKWQYFWAWPKPRPNKRFEIQPMLGLWLHASRRSRREEIVLARFHIGHTHHIYAEETNSRFVFHVIVIIQLNTFFWTAQSIVTFDKTTMKQQR
jgi:hypothetical protein